MVIVNILNNQSNIQINTGTVQRAKKWELEDSLRDKIVALANKDAANGIYMGNEFNALRQGEVAKVAPNRAALIARFSQAMNGNLGNMKRVQEADNKWLCMLFGIPYEGKIQSSQYGSATHIYDENGDEILTYTSGTGWHEKPSKAENMVHSKLKYAYYDAYHKARKAMGSPERQALIGIGGELVEESKFDIKT